MQRKPWPIIILTIIFALMPISNLITTYIILKHDVTFFHYLYSLIAVPANHIRVLNLFAPALIATYAIFSVKRWSYALLFISVAWVYANSFKNIGADLNTLQIVFSLVLPFLFGLFVLFYFLTPSVRQTYFDPSLKWWEAKPRYFVDILIDIVVNGSDRKITIKNISEGGVLIDSNEQMSKDDQFKMVFELEGYSFSTEAKIIFKNPSNNEYGVQFLTDNKSFAMQMNEAVNILKSKNFKRCREPIPWKSDFKAWFDKLRSSGKGLTPEIPTKRRNTEN